MTIAPVSSASNTVHHAQHAAHRPPTAVQSAVDPDHDGDRDAAGKPDVDKARVDVIA